MPRQAKLFSSSAGSVVRGYLKFRANITPRWIRNARTSRKHVEPEIVRSFRALSQLKKNRPRARIAIESCRGVGLRTCRLPGRRPIQRAGTARQHSLAVSLPR